MHRIPALVSIHHISDSTLSADLAEADIVCVVGLSDSQIVKGNQKLIDRQKPGTLRVAYVTYPEERMNFASATRTVADLVL